MGLGAPLAFPAVQSFLTTSDCQHQLPVRRGWISFTFEQLFQHHGHNQLRCCLPCNCLNPNELLRNNCRDHLPKSAMSLLLLRTGILHALPMPLRGSAIPIRMPLWFPAARTSQGLRGTIAVQPLALMTLRGITLRSSGWSAPRWRNRRSVHFAPARLGGLREHECGRSPFSTYTEQGSAGSGLVEASWLQVSHGVLGWSKASAH